MISQASVKNSVQGGFCLWVWGCVSASLSRGCTPPRQTPPGRHPAGRLPPRQPLQRKVRILLECILVKRDISWPNLHNILNHHDNLRKFFTTLTSQLCKQSCVIGGTLRTGKFSISLLYWENNAYMY